MILGDSKTNAHLTKYDTVHGRFNEEVTFDDEALYINKIESALSLNVTLQTFLGQS